MNRLVAILLSCVFGCAAEAAAQTAPPPTVQDGRLWFVGTVQDRFAKDSKWRWSIENIVRSREGVSELDVYALRGTVQYALTSRSSIGGGYAYAPSYPPSGGATTENRWFQQFAWSGAVGGGTLATRSRVEQRFIEGNSGVLGRFRQQVRFSKALHQGGKISYIGYDELFVHLNNTTRSPRGVDQNRIFGGLGFALSPKIRVEAGYLNQFSPGHGKAAKMNHVLSTSLAISLR